MTDDLSRSQEEAVRRLLADARETEPMPAEIAARLDAVIADLARPATADAGQPDTGRPATGTGATVVPLRRRRLPRLVLAAAAVTALGLGTAQVLDRSGGDRSSDDRAGAADTGEAAEPDDGDATALQEDRRDGARSPRTAPAPADEGPVLDYGAGADAGASGEPREQDYAAAPVTIAGLDRALRAQGLGPVGRLDSVEPLGTASSKQLSAFRSTVELQAGTRCGPLYDVVDGSAYTSRRAPDTLVVAHPPVNGIRLVEVYDCAGNDPRHSAGVVTLATEE